MKQHHSAIPSKNTKYQVAKRAPQKNRNKIPPMLKTLTYATYFSFLVQMACAKWWVHFEKKSLDCKRARWIMRERERVSWFKAFKNEEEEKYVDVTFFASKYSVYFFFCYLPHAIFTIKVYCVHVLFPHPQKKGFNIFFCLFLVCFNSKTVYIITQISIDDNNDPI